MSAPLVTVLTASYNYACWLPEAVRSVLAQTCGDLELLILEDGSADNSADVARALAAEDPRVRLIFHPDSGNHGLPETLRLGLRHARGRWIAFLEADDRWLPRSLQARLDAAASRDAGFAFCDIEPLSHADAALDWFNGYVPRIMAEHRRLQRDAVAAGRPYSLAGRCLLENPIPTFSCALARADLLRACNWTPPVNRWFDWWLWCQLAHAAPVAFVPDPLVQWRLHSASQHHGVGSGYLRDYALMGRSLRDVLRPRLSPLWSAFLALPAPLRLAVRLARMLRYSSLSDTLRRIRRRLKG